MAVSVAEPMDTPAAVGCNYPIYFALAILVSVYWLYSESPNSLGGSFGRSEYRVDVKKAELAKLVWNGQVVQVNHNVLVRRLAGLPP